MVTALDATNIEFPRMAVQLAAGRTIRDGSTKE
ncbi:hypothetical protein FB555_000920 [Alpinimonas psychrophila]|uniref:Uncharacterized protein n=1 Tax=Alpinimonas psychrophila TaxID=748908 RepID=A0A7W3JT97_9MICO|nr:hypothetical protein [Alpinimonas psychrophila]